MTTQARRPAAVWLALTPLLLCIVVTPPGLAFIGLASSMAMGTMIAGCFAIALTFGMLKVSSSSIVQAVQYLVLFVLGIVLHLVVAATMGQVDLSRGLVSLLPLCLCIAGGWATAELFAHVHQNKLDRTLKRVLFLLGVIALLGAAGWAQPISLGSYAKPVFPFSEPSHLAIISAPFLIFACATSRPIVRLLYLAAAFIATLTLENLTMGVVTILAAVLSIKPRYLISIALVMAPILVTLDFSYYIDRLEFNDQSQNLSALVYLQGWQLLQESLERTYGFGVGFQQLGALGTNATASNQIYLLSGESLNLLDGGFTLSKLLGEFGVFSGALLIIYLALVIRAIRLLRRVVLYGERRPIEIIFASSCIVGYLIEMLFRGVGYFTPTGMLLITAIIIWRRHEIPNRILARRLTS